MLLETKLIGCIITYNEEIHIERSLASLISLNIPVLVIDSHSTDNTVNIAQSMNAIVIRNEFIDYGTQRAFAIDKAKELGFEWMLFLDADEYLTEELKNEIFSLKLDKDVEGFSMKRRVYWNGTWLRYGGYYPIRFLRIFKISKASLTRGINEHILVSGKVQELKFDFVDDNLNGIDRWIQKHIKYSSYESEEWYRNGLNKLTLPYKILRSLPLILQPIVYFIYRVIIRGGYRNGYSGIWFFMFHSVVLVGLTAFKYRERIKQS